MGELGLLAREPRFPVRKSGFLVGKLCFSGRETWFSVWKNWFSGWKTWFSGRTQFSAWKTWIRARFFLRCALRARARMGPLDPLGAFESVESRWGTVPRSSLMVKRRVHIQYHNT